LVQSKYIKYSIIRIQLSKAKAESASVCKFKVLFMKMRYTAALD